MAERQLVRTHDAVWEEAALATAPALYPYLCQAGMLGSSLLEAFRGSAPDDMASLLRDLLGRDSTQEEKDEFDDLLDASVSPAQAKRLCTARAAENPA